RRARAEAIAAVVVGGVDRFLRGVPWHSRWGEVHSPPGIRRRVCLGEVVVRERMEAHARIEEVARAGAVGAAERPGATGGAGRVALLARIDGPVATEHRQRRAGAGRGGRRVTARVRATGARPHVDAATLSTGARGLHGAPLALPRGKTTLGAGRVARGTAAPAGQHERPHGAERYAVRPDNVCH